MKLNIKKVGTTIGTNFNRAGCKSATHRIIGPLMFIEKYFEKQVTNDEMNIVPHTLFKVEKKYIFHILI